MPKSPIRVLLVEDSPIATVILKRILTSTSDIELTGTASNGLEALALMAQARPDVVCTDLHMPKMDGLELTRRIMSECPRPILVISASVQEDDVKNVFDLIEAGALDVFPKPRAGLNAEYEQIQRELINKIKVLSGVAVFTQHRHRATAPTPPVPTTAPAPKLNSSSINPSKPSPAPINHQPARYTPSTTRPLDIRTPRVLAIGASTGGPRALQLILRSLPANFPVPVLCVQHISDGFLQGLVDWLDQGCALKVAIAQPHQAPQAGTIYFAPERQHLELSDQGLFQVSTAPAVDGHCPSVTVLFRSIAKYYRRSAVGILLTGMGRDGATGLLDMSEAGATTIAQDEATSIVFGMPRAAIALNAAQRILPIQEIAPFLLSRVFG
ncbi:MAG: chemotaxis-specific protein-glutamate methyltransferase CheB [Thainema sp.]